MILSLLFMLILAASGFAGLTFWLSKERAMKANTSPTQWDIESPPKNIKTRQRPDISPEHAVEKDKKRSLETQPEIEREARQLLDSQSSSTPSEASAASSSSSQSEIPTEREQAIELIESITDEPDPEELMRHWAAQEWFARGQELADSSEEEFSMYQKALEVDPHFAPAHYYRGVIYFERGERDAALAAFRQFLEYASDEERSVYLLPESVSQEEVTQIEVSK
jgi:tetratricopeptide (TPR) repeat protein